MEMENRRITITESALLYAHNAQSKKKPCHNVTREAEAAAHTTHGGTRAHNLHRLPGAPPSPALSPRRAGLSAPTLRAHQTSLPWRKAHAPATWLPRVMLLPCSIIRLFRAVKS